MTIGERIFLRLGEIGMSQKDFAEKTGIAQSTISEWKTKKNNPTADKILIICDVLDVSPYWLLSGTEKSGKRGNNTDYFVIGKETELGSIVSEYNGLGQRNKDRFMGYCLGFIELMKKSKK